MKEIMFNNEPVKVLSATGYHDGYYWDMNAKVEFRGETYSMYDAGSYSGWIKPCSAVTKEPFERLYGAEQKTIELDNDEWEYVEGMICELLTKFIEFEAKTSWEVSGDFKRHVLVDGVEIENRKE